MMRRSFIFVAFCAIALFPQFLYAHEDTTLFCLSNDKVALGGYDPVSFWSGRVKKGNGRISHTTDSDVIYFFASKESREKFIKNPERFLPSFGGLCAMSLAMGRKNCPDFRNFAIDDKGRLLLFERTGFSNGRILWEQAPEENWERAEKVFNKIPDSPPERSRN